MSSRLHACASDMNSLTVGTASPGRGYTLQRYASHLSELLLRLRDIEHVMLL
jgi:hypothetical protein